MADQGLFDKSTQTSRQAGDFVRINRAYAPNPSGRADYKIDVDNFLAPEQADIATNQGNIANLDSRVTTLEEITSKRYDQSKTTDFTFTQNEDSSIFEIYAIKVSGSPTVAIGTTLAGDDILSSRAITDDYRSTDGLFYTGSNRTIYVTISGGTIDLITFTREQLRT